MSRVGPQERYVPRDNYEAMECEEEIRDRVAESALAVGAPLPEEPLFVDDAQEPGSHLELDDADTQTFKISAYVLASPEQLASNPKLASFTLTPQSVEAMRHWEENGTAFGDPSKTVILDMNVTSKQNNFPFPLLCKVNGFLSKHIGANTKGSIFLAPNSIDNSQENIYHLKKKLTQRMFELYTPVKEAADQIHYYGAGRDLASVFVGSCAWRLMEEMAEDGHWPQFELPHIGDPQAYEEEQKIDVPVRVAKDVHEVMNLMEQSINKSLIDLNNFAVTFKRDGVAWNYPGKYVGQEMGARGPTKGRVDTSVMSTTAFAKVTLEVKYHML